jgi:hypothetical protein
MFTSSQTLRNRKETPDGDVGTDDEGGDHMTAQTDFSPETVEDLYALWDQLRAAAISESDRHEIDDIFARQLP